MAKSKGPLASSQPAKPAKAAKGKGKAISASANTLPTKKDRCRRRKNPGTGEKGKEREVIDLTMEDEDHGPSDGTQVEMLDAGPSLQEESSPAVATTATTRRVQPNGTWRPMSRSILAGVSKLSPDDIPAVDSPGAGPSRLASPNPSGDVIIEEIAAAQPGSARSPSPNTATHFDPPGLFTTSMMRSLVASSSRIPLVELKADRGVSPSSSGKGEVKEAVLERLLLPANVLLDVAAGGEHAGDGRDIGQEGEADMAGLHFVDDDVAKGVARYFDPSADDDHEASAEATFLATADQSKICSNCKKPGHKPRDCPHTICTTCGAWDEHPRNECPASLVCFGCGGRGHKLQNCPDPASRYARRSGCNLCGSMDHKDKVCPTLWRIYVYQSSSERQHTLEVKEGFRAWEKEATAGIAEQDWCYNCAREGHLGDDCSRPRGSLARFNGPSAFSHIMASRGPYSASSSKAAAGNHMRWDDEELPDTIPAFAGYDAGRKTKEKERKRMADMEASEDDVDEWFNRSPGDLSIRGAGMRRGRSTPTRARTAVPAKPWQSERRGSSVMSSTLNGNGLPFSHGHLMSAATPATAPAHIKVKGISFGRLSTPGGGSPTPHGARDPGRGAMTGAAAMVARALGNGHTSLPRKPSSASSTSHAPWPLASRESTPSAGRKKRRRQEDVGRDWEADWRADERLGGNVQRWGREMDAEERRARREHERRNANATSGRDGLYGNASGKRPGVSAAAKGAPGQRYHGGY